MSILSSFQAFIAQISTDINLMPMKQTLNVLKASHGTNKWVHFNTYDKVFVFQWFFPNLYVIRKVIGPIFNFFLSTIFNPYLVCFKFLMKNLCLVFDPFYMSKYPSTFPPFSHFDFAVSHTEYLCILSMDITQFPTSLYYYNIN